VFTIKKMAYRDINLSKQATTPKENLTPVFSEFIGETEGQGKIDNFISDSTENLNMASNISADAYEVKFNNELSKLLEAYQRDTNENERWLTIMGMIERKILQLRCYKNPTLAFSIQSQKSGDNIFSYIVIRAVFFDLYSGKKEIRRYFNKMEDYPQFNGLEELKSNPSFLNDALIEIKSIMAELINKEDIKIEYLESELRKLKRSSRAGNLNDPIDEDAKKKAGADRREMFRKKMKEKLDKMTQEQKDEIERYRNALKIIDKSKDDENMKRIMKTKEKESHKEQMDRIKSKRNFNL
jgi:hypothetical protein